MKEYIEFRILERYASEFLKPNQGKRLGDSVRLVIISTDDPLLHIVKKIELELHEKGEYLFYGWDIFRKYTPFEIQSAELFHIDITAVFEPAGEECGTIYDEKTACAICGAGRKQVSDLILDLRKTPKGKDIAKTIADEWIIKKELAERLVDAKLSGFELHPVKHKAQYLSDPMDLTKVPSGREILRRADEMGYKFSSWEFNVWINRTEQYELAEKAREEHAILLEKSFNLRPKPMPVWYQLVIVSTPIHTRLPTKFKSRPFSSLEDDERFHCPLGHVSGLNLFSEIWVSRQDWDGSDFLCTEDMAGKRKSLLVTSPMLLISPRVQKMFVENNIKGYRANIAHFV
jgi:hypothetical protein